MIILIESPGDIFLFILIFHNNTILNQLLCCKSIIVLLFVSLNLANVSAIALYQPVYDRFSFFSFQIVFFITILVFAKTREQEFIDRINGLTYEEIAAKGGGILNSAQAINNIKEDKLYEISKSRLDKTIQWYLNNPLWLKEIKNTDYSEWINKQYS